MSVRCGTHRPVFRIFLKDRLKVWHIFVNQIFQRNNNSLLCITKQIIIAHSCIKQTIRKVSKLCQCQILFIGKLVCHKTGPVNMYIRLFFESLKNNPLVRILRRGCRSTCDK